MRKLEQIERAIKSIMDAESIRVHIETAFCSVRAVADRDSDAAFNLTSRAGAGKVLQHLAHTEDLGSMALIAVAYALQIRLGDCCSGN